MKHIKIFCVITVFAICTLGIARFCHSRTRGFKLTKITENCPLKVSKVGNEALPEGVPSRFTFLGRGLQSFAFVSDDNQMVLKLFNNRYQRKIFWFSHLPGCQEKAYYNTGKLKKIATSYQIANRELRDETGVLYMHLAPTRHLKKTVILVDHIGIEHTINLDKFGFVLQKRVTMAYPYLNEAMIRGERSKAEKAIHSLVNLLITRFQKGVHDNDPLIRTNCGFLDGQAYLIDLGPFSKDLSIRDPMHYRKEIKRITGSLRRWIEHHHPELSAALEDTLKTALSHEAATL